MNDNNEYVKDEEHLCVCKTCGESKTIIDFRARKGGVRNTSCRDCVNQKYYVRDPQQAHLNAIRCRAKKQGLPFDLEYHDIDIPIVCEVLGVPLSPWGSGDKYNTSTDINTPSVDKLIPSLGYVKSNIRVISNRANIIKNDMTLDECKKLLKYMTRHLS